MIKYLIIITIVCIIYLFIQKDNSYKSKYIEYNLYNGVRWGPKETSDAYRFGDIFSGYMNGNLNKFPNYLRDIDENYPNSFGSKYVKYSGYPKSLKNNDYDILTRIFKEYNYKIPDNETLIIHLRLGDVLSKPNSKYFYNIDYYYELLEKIKQNKNIKKVYIVTGLHFNVNIKESNDRLNQIRNIFEESYPVKVIITNDPDKDLYYMCHSKYFAKSGEIGGFTNIISEYVKRNNNIVYGKK